ncbi:MAG TPA: metalloregulator ArsR/SmtB family transcription factor [Steroidobacteraceae bacterium]|nr:metalloregulator ArsR/SmtB family transcription factor [Steroidobacteraceae bacterium]
MTARTGTRAGRVSLARAAREMRPQAARAARLLKAIGNAQRLMILCSLVPGPLSVGEINEHVALSQSALSQHLAVLRDAGVVVTRRESQSVVYSLPTGVVTRIIGELHGEFCPRRPRPAIGSES